MGGLDGEGGVSNYPGPNDDLKELGSGAAGEIDSGWEFRLFLLLVLIF